MKLIVVETGQEAVFGETYPDFRGEPRVLTGGHPPEHSASTGRVYLGEDEVSVFPGVVGMKWVSPPTFRFVASYVDGSGVNQLMIGPACEYWGDAYDSMCAAMVSIEKAQGSLPEFEYRSVMSLEDAATRIEDYAAVLRESSAIHGTRSTEGDS